MQEEKISTNVTESTGYSYGIKMNFSSMWQDFVYIKTKWKYIINLRVECKTTKLQEENRENYFYYFRMGKNSNAWTI